MYYDKDADLSLTEQDRRHHRLRRQGHAQAQNLRDSGVEVIVAELPGTDNCEHRRVSTASSRSAAAEAPSRPTSSRF